MSVVWEEFGFESLFDLQIQQMTLYSTLLLINEADKSLVLRHLIISHFWLKKKSIQKI